MRRLDERTDQRRRLVHPRSGQVGHQAGRRSERQLDEPGATSPCRPAGSGVRAGRGITGSFAIFSSHDQDQVVELRGPQRRPRTAGVGDPLGLRAYAK